MKKPKAKKVISAGGVIYRKKGDRIEIALIVRNNGQILGLPKGLVEPNESLEEAALREVREETGLKGRLIEQIGQIDYWFFWPPDNIRYHKFVHFYLMEEIGGDISMHDHEVEEVRWIPLDEAGFKLTYKSERDIVDKAQKLLG